MMDINELFNYVKSDYTHSNKKSTNESTSDKTYQDYLAETDPNTGKPFIIPMLGMNDPDYCNEYVSMMKFREFDPESFQKILNWD